MKSLTNLRNNWKKTVFGLGVGTYAIDYCRETYQISTVMRTCSEEAAKYGEQCKIPRKLVVILNPAANKQKSEKNFKKYCEPILHLAGFLVDIVRTDSEGYAKTYMEQLKSLPDAVVIAGGDGTVSEVLTGMMRRSTGQCPIALLPLGKENDVAKKYLNFSSSSKLEKVEALIRASLSIARENVQEKSVFKIEPISLETDETPEAKPIYSAGYVQWGILADLKKAKDKYWYFGDAKSYFAALMNVFNNNLAWICKADVNYTLPCSGCKNCATTKNNTLMRRSIWDRLFFRSNTVQAYKSDFKADESQCKEQYSGKIDSSNVRIYIDESDEMKKLVLEKRETMKPGGSFLYQYAKELSKGEPKPKETMQFRTMTLLPDDESMASSNYYYIDNELYDIRPMKLTLIPRAIQLLT